MIGNLRTWFAGRSMREKRLLLVMFTLLALTVIWAGVVRQVGDRLSTSRELYAATVEHLAETKSRVAAIRSLQANRPAPLAGGLAEAVRGAAQDAGFVITNLNEPATGEVHVVLQSVRPGAFSAWLVQLERSGVLVDAAQLTQNGDRTVAADLTLRSRV